MLLKARLECGYTIEELNERFKDKLKALKADDQAAKIKLSKHNREAYGQAVKQPDIQALKEARKAADLATTAIEKFKEGLFSYTVHFEGFKLTIDQKYDLLIGKPTETLYSELTAPKQAKLDEDEEDDRQYKRGMKK
ncbi:hypothetical protein ACFOW1_06390 [Parasediminibacterium paludis]|uniref:Uncharacterized protein n=1 Tax=Parasediminibacterium paludis TaxID=908966 RepID=A0ABV8PTS3_9BACT